MADPVLLPHLVNTPSRRERLWLKWGGKCHWCDKPTRLHPKLNGQPDYEAWDMATIDHIVPRYKEGTNDDDNLVSACRLCNSRRNHEDALGLPEGALLGNYKPGQRKRYNRIALTADDKKKIGNGQYNKPVSSKTVEDVLREQRDQALRELQVVRIELKLYQRVVEDQERELNRLRSVSIWKSLRIRIANMILPK